MKQAPSFTLQTLEGKSWTLDEARAKVIMLTFWTSWCPDSQRDLNAKASLYNSMKTKDMQMVMIHVTGRDPGVDLEQFMKDHKYTFPVLLDEGTSVYDLYHCMGVPTTILINEHKEIVYNYNDKATMINILKGVGALLDR